VALRVSHVAQAHELSCTDANALRTATTSAVLAREGRQSRCAQQAGSRRRRLRRVVQAARVLTKDALRQQATSASQLAKLERKFKKVTPLCIIDPQLLDPNAIVEQDARQEEGGLWGVRYVDGRGWVYGFLEDSYSHVDNDAQPGPDTFEVFDDRHNLHSDSHGGEEINIVPGENELNLGAQCELDAYSYGTASAGLEFNLVNHGEGKSALQAARELNRANMLWEAKI
jgi:hypothetical protein